MNNKTKKIAVLAMLTAMAFVLFLLEIPLIPGNSYLKMDLSDIPALAGGILLSPLATVIIEALKNIIELLVKGLGSQMGFGNIMNFIVGAAYTLTFTLVYNKLKEKKKTEIALLISSISGFLAIVVFGIAGNYFIAPLFFKYFLSIELSTEALWAAVWSGTVMNIIKGIFLSIVSFPLIKVVCKRIKLI